MAKKKYVMETVASVNQHTEGVNRAVKGIHAYQNMGNGLSKLNTMRGGTKGFKGFVMEELEAGKACALGQHTEVINNNGLADLRYTKADGSEVLIQMKTGYKPGQIDFNRYEGQTVVLDKGNAYFDELHAAGKEAGVNVVQGNVTDAEAKLLADMMQMETKITGAKNAKVVPKLYSGYECAKTAHKIGLKVAKSGSIAGGGFSFGYNAMEVAMGNKELADAGKDVLTDTLKAGVTAYTVGTGCSILASTEIGENIIDKANEVIDDITSNSAIGPIITSGYEAISNASEGIENWTSDFMDSVENAADKVGCGDFIEDISPYIEEASPYIAGGFTIGALCGIYKWLKKD